MIAEGTEVQNCGIGDMGLILSCAVVLFFDLANDCPPAPTNSCGR